MKKVFADTSYWIALTSKRDPFRSKAAQLAPFLDKALILTSELVLAEYLTSYCRMGPFIRKNALQYVKKIRENPNILVITFQQLSFDAGFDLYSKRPDKTYSFTDSISMVIMREKQISEVLTTDQHFEQEGFTRLLK